ncbi:NADPH-dependent FMN reductase [Thermosinus carboxydivorans Nor1]|uniref:NADPH-dependent FMN reductase n=1 Tax=Thermosinus carboxydivorans Nor1 TaxID=401526 RepID=A1HLZ7_9FIRM|nr:flavodoxin family protein [Thermosinus carboxydivorans]EAX48849.1 NADPH-dependent FMN reductase [Thermosinus carboxydivorans Nor1]
MKVVAFNGSPRANGNTAYALNVVGEELKKEGIEFEVIQVGNKMIRGCIACMGCVKNQNERCAIANDEVNDWIQKMKEADGILLGSPVYYAGIPGTMKSFLDRAFFVTSVNQSMLRHKVGATVAVVRRSGGVATFDALNRYIMYSEMIMPTSNYWNVTHGHGAGEAVKDEEGNQILRILGKNMAWLLKVLAAGKPHVKPVPPEAKILTNFIR